MEKKMTLGEVMAVSAVKRESSQQRRDNIQQLFQAVGGPQGLEYLRNNNPAFYTFVLSAYNIEMLDEKSE